MKKSGLILLFLVLCFQAFSQDKTVSVDGQTYQLKTAVEGTWDLLWNVMDGQYRYFIRTSDGHIQELTNTKNSSGKYQNEFRTLLQDLSNNTMDTSRLKLTLGDLKHCFNVYNVKQDNQYTFDTRPKVTARLGFFAGFTNTPFIDNPDNKLSGLLGTELELYGNQKFKRHAGFLQLATVFENKDLGYSTTEIALGYRFRFIYTDRFNLHANLKMATLNFSKSRYRYEQNNQVITNDESSTVFDAPLTFGLGADFKVGEHGFITFYYNEIVSATVNNQGNFPTSFALGYKVAL